MENGRKKKVFRIFSKSLVWIIMTALLTQVDGWDQAGGGGRLCKVRPVPRLSQVVAVPRNADFFIKNASEVSKLKFRDK